MVTLTPKTFQVKFVDVKLCSRGEDVAADALLDEMVKRMEYTRDWFTARYCSDPPRPDHCVLRGELGYLLSYYLDRAWRHGWVSREKDREALARHVRRLETAYPQVTTACEGFLVHPAVTETREITRGDHRIRIIGSRSIEEDTQFHIAFGARIAPHSAATQIQGDPKTEAVGSQDRLQARTETGLEQLSTGAVCGKSTPQMGAPRVVTDRALPSVALGRSVLDDQLVEWRPSLLGSPHVLLVGSTGSGKSTTLRHILASLARHDLRFLVLDFHGDLTEGLERDTGTLTIARMDAAEGLPFSPLEPVSAAGRANLDTKTVSYEVAEVIGFVCGLGEMQQDLVYRALSDCYDRMPTGESAAYPPMAHLQRRLEELEREPGAPHNVVARCRQLLDFKLFADVTDGEVFRRMLDQQTAVVLGKLQIEQLQYAAVSFVLRRVYREMFLWGEQKGIRLMVVLDEAHRVAKDPTLPRLMKEGRKFGVGMIVASQEIRDFHEAVIHNAGTKILFRTNYPESRRLAKFVQSRETKEGDFARRLEVLPVGRAFVQTQQMPRCVECLMGAD